MVLRKAAVAGAFYPRYKPDLLRVLKDSFINKEFGPGEELKVQNKERTVIGGVSPHAGYVYSGCATAYTFLNLFKEKVPDTVILLGTDHVGYGKVGLMEEGEWETPLGNLTIDSEVANSILSGSGSVVADESAFMGFPFGREHNIEVQLPFIKYCAGDKDIKIVPIKVSTKDLKKMEIVASDIAGAITSNDKDIVVIASSDMTHKQPKNVRKPKDDLEEMRNKDKAVMDAFEEFNPEKTLKAATQTSVCGPQTITTLMLVGKSLNATQAKALKYYMSYEKGGGKGPCEYSVGYFSGIITK